MKESPSKHTSHGSAEMSPSASEMSPIADNGEPIEVVEPPGQRPFSDELQELAEPLTPIFDAISAIADAQAEEAKARPLVAKEARLQTEAQEKTEQLRVRWGAAITLTLVVLVGVLAGLLFVFGKEDIGMSLIMALFALFAGKSIFSWTSRQ